MTDGIWAFLGIFVAALLGSWLTTRQHRITKVWEEKYAAYQDILERIHTIRGTFLTLGQAVNEDNIEGAAEEIKLRTMASRKSMESLDQHSGLSALILSAKTTTMLGIFIRALRAEVEAFEAMADKSDNNFSGDAAVKFCGRVAQLCVHEVRLVVAEGRRDLGLKKWSEDYVWSSPKKRKPAIAGQAKQTIAAEPTMSGGAGLSALHPLPGTH